jgi:hypothetical protein
MQCRCRREAEVTRVVGLSIARQITIKQYRLFHVNRRSIARHSHCNGEDNAWDFLFRVALSVRIGDRCLFDLRTEAEPRKEEAMAEEKAPNKRELIDTGRDKRFVRRDEKGRFDEVADVGRSLSQDVRKHAKTKVPPGQGDRGDQAKE